MSAGTSPRRRPLDVTAERRVRDARVIEMREAGVPTRVIAQTLSISEPTVRFVIRRYYARIVDADDWTQHARKAERRAQLEAAQARLAVLVGLGPDSAALAAKGFTVQQWLAAVEQTRRLVGDLINLDGLAGPMTRGDQDDGAVLPGSPAYKTAAVTEWLGELGKVNPALKAHIINTLAAERVRALGEGDEAGDDDGLRPDRDRPGGLGTGGPDPGPAGYGGESGGREGAPG